MIEQDYVKDEELKIAYDIYQLTIAANITKVCSPTQLMFCLK